LPAAENVIPPISTTTLPRGGLDSIRSRSGQYVVVSPPPFWRTSITSLRKPGLRGRAEDPADHRLRRRGDLVIAEVERAAALERGEQERLVEPR
jgi:hypothetical protein